MSNSINRDIVRRIGFILTSALVLASAQWATPAAAAGSVGSSGGDEVGNRYGAKPQGGGGGVDPAAIDSGNIGPILSLQASTPTIGFGQTVEGVLGDGDEVSLETGQLADFYRFSTTAPETAYTITAASREFLMDSVVYVFDPVAQVYVALQEAKVFTPESPVAQYSGTLPQAGEYAIQISSASTELQNGGYALNLSGPSETSDALVKRLGGGGQLGGDVGTN